MKPAMAVLVLLAVSGMAFATQQVPDILHYNDLKISVSTGWGHPSPLETY